MKREVRQTEDGSSTIYIPELDENYHSYHGALQEARHVFITNGLNSFEGVKSLRVFEMGFGTGLNALLTMQYAQENQVDVVYHGIEAYPVEIELIKELNYTSQINVALNEEFYTMHRCSWGEQHKLFPGFTFQKIHEKIECYQGELATFDCVFFDAFGPRAQAEMWDFEILAKVTSLLSEGGCLVTYCAKGQLKRDLKSLGLVVETLPGPPGKREMTRAWKRKLIS